MAPASTEISAGRPVSWARCCTSRRKRRAFVRPGSAATSMIRFTRCSASLRAIGRASTISRWVAQSRTDALPRCLRTIWRKHDEHPDNLVDFSQAFGATQLLQSGHQPHSGYIEGNQLLLFSNQADAHREAVGDALIGPGQTLLNVGIQLPLAVNWDKPTPEGDLKTLADAITRLQATLESLTRQLLDPAYVNFTPKIAPKPEALLVLRMAGFARLWSAV